MEPVRFAGHRMAFAFARRLRLLPAARWFPVLLAFTGTTIASGDPQESPKPASTAVAAVEAAAPKVPWERIVMVGASVSAGFTLAEPLGGSNTPQYRLSRFLDAALLAPHQPVRNLGNTLFFLRAETLGQSQLKQALETRPTMVIGIDFLFWFCYGDVFTEEERLQRFEQGLKLLEPVQCPLVLGDIPDASAATNSILREEQIPNVAIISAANRRLRQWAATRPHVVIVPLSQIMRSASANQAITIRGRTWPAGKTRAFLQDDMLHPSASGCAALALAIADAVLSAQPNLSSNAIRWDPEEVLALGSARVPEPPANPERPAAPARSSETPLQRRP